MMELKKVPDLRFKSYLEDWESSKLGDLMDVSSVKRVHKSDWRSTGVRFLRARDIVAESQHEEPDDYLYIDQQMYEQFSTQSGKVQKGDLLVTGVGTIGVPMLIKNDMPIYFKDGNIIWLKNNNSLDGQFLYYSFISRQIQNFIKMSAGTGTVGTYTIDNGKKTPINYPSIRAEQKDIGELFFKIDDLITSYWRKYKILASTKKSMLEKMFPQGDSKVPELRFKGFSDDWEQRKLSDIAYSFEYGLNAAGKDYDGLHKYLRITDIDDSTHEFLQNNLTSPDADLSKCGNYKLQNGDIVFARTGASVGKTYIYKESDGLVYFAGFLIRIKIKPNYDAEFIFQNTLTSAYDKYIRITSQRSGQPGVNAKEYGDYTLMVPTLREQEKIGKYMRNIDSLIGFYQHKAEKLQSIKKFMLEKMFI